jgi:hypothetical protein
LWPFCVGGRMTLYNSVISTFQHDTLACGVLRFILLPVPIIVWMVNFGIFCFCVCLVGITLYNTFTKKTTKKITKLAADTRLQLVHLDNLYNPEIQSSYNKLLQLKKDLKIPSSAFDNPLALPARHPPLQDPHQQAQEMIDRTVRRFIKEACLVM